VLGRVDSLASIGIHRATVAHHT